MMTLQPVPLAKACRLLNHGPTVLVSAAHGGPRNVMAAAWNMPLDFQADAQRSIHYIAGGNFFVTGEAFEVKG